MNCENCNEEHDGSYGSGRFCCQKCSRSFSTKEKRLEINKKVSKKLKGVSKEGVFYNRNNSKEVKQKRVEGLRKFHKQKKEKIKETTLFQNWSKKMKVDHVFEEIGNKCEKCGYQYTNEKTGKGPFEIHHIDGNNNNWVRKNLQVLCLNCHWKTPNWRFRGKTHTEETKRIIGEKTKERS